MSLEWPMTKTEAAEIKQQKTMALAGALQHPAHQWMAQKLRLSGLRMNPQAAWGWRLFDFWCAEKGVAIDLIEPGDATDYTDVDLKELFRSGILIRRLRHFDNNEADYLIQMTKEEPFWNARRAQMGLKPIGSGKV